jgi:hypothetical protein
VSVSPLKVLLAAFVWRRTLAAMKPLFCSLLVAGAFLSTQASDRFVVYVAPNGNDHWSGRLPAPNTDDGPFATIHRAQIAVRDWLADSAKRPAPRRGRRCTSGAGLYQLDQPLTLTPQDSQTIFALTRPNAHPQRRGAHHRLGVGDDGRWRADLPAVREQGWHFTQLFVNDQRRPRPRLPATGHYLIAGELAASDEALGGIDRFQFGRARSGRIGRT